MTTILGMCGITMNYSTDGDKSDNGRFNMSYFNVILRWKSNRNTTSPVTTVKLECLLAKDRAGAVQTAFQMVLGGDRKWEVQEVMEL